MKFQSSPSYSPELNGLELLGNIQPFWLDIDADMVTDFLFQDGKDKKIKVARGKSKDSTSFELIEFKDMLLPKSVNSDCLDFNDEDEISSPHSNTFVDLNDDCIPDIFLTRIEKSTGQLYYEVYIQMLVDGQSKYCLVQTKQKLIPDGFPEKKSETELSETASFYPADSDPKDESASNQEEKEASTTKSNDK